MGQIKIYPATKEQAENIQDTVDEINSKVGGQLQVKTVMPSNVQQTVQADAGYTALSGVVVNPIAALMPQTVEDYIMRNERTEPFSINVNGSIPNYACYGQNHLAAVYGELNGAIKSNAFNRCSSLQTIDARNVTSIEDNAFSGCSSLQNVDARNVTSIKSNAFYGCLSLRNIDCTSCTTPPTIQAYTFPTNNTFRVIAATDTEKTLFQSATNWSAIADQIYTAAEIEALYGDTYDNLYLQWFGHPRFDESEGE